MTSLNYLGKEVKNGRIITDNPIRLSSFVRDFYSRFIARIPDYTHAIGERGPRNCNPDNIKVIVFKGKADYIA